MAGFDLACAATPLALNGSISFVLILLIAATVLTIAVGRMAHFHGKPFLLVAQVAVLFWLFTTAGEIAAQTPGCKIAWSSMAWVAIVLTPTAWGLFIHRYVNSIRSGVRRPEILLMTLPPLAILAIVATNPLHQMFYGPGTGPVSALPGAPIRYDHGPLFYAAAAYLYGFMAYSVVVVTWGALTAPRLHRMRFRAMLAVISLPVVMNLAYIFSDLTIAGVDGTPFSFLTVTAAFSWLILSDEFFSILPVGNRVLMEKLREPVLFLSDSGTVIRANPAAERLRTTDDSGEKRWNPDLLALVPKLSEMLDTARFVQIGNAHYEVRASALEAPFSASGAVAGWMLLLKDVTAIKAQALDLEYALTVSRRRLKALTKLHAEVRNQATSDPLTGLANRRGLEDLLANLASDPQQSGAERLLAVVDIDYFKKINDQHGHSAGDEVLRQFAQIARRHFRRKDMIFRVGGEEFLFLLPAMTEAELAVRLDLMRRDLRALQPVGASFSAGMAAWNGERAEFETVYELADKRLYVAKKSGRDRTIGTKTAMRTIQAAWSNWGNGTAADYGAITLDPDLTRPPNATLQ